MRAAVADGIWLSRAPETTPNMRGLSSTARCDGLLATASAAADVALSGQTAPALHERLLIKKAVRSPGRAGPRVGPPRGRLPYAGQAPASRISQGWLAVT